MDILRGMKSTCTAYKPLTLEEADRLSIQKEIPILQENADTGVYKSDSCECI